METVTTLIGALGFPIVACVFMWRYINTTLKDFTATMAANTQMLSRICDRLDILSEEETHGEQ